MPLKNVFYFPILALIFYPLTVGANEPSDWDRAGVEPAAALASDTVSNQSGIDFALANLQDGMHVILTDGLAWNNTEIEFSYNAPADKPIIIRPQTPGGVTLNAPSIILAGQNIVLQDFIIEGGSIIPVRVGYQDSQGAVVTCTNCRVTNNTFTDTGVATSGNRPWVQVFGNWNRIDHNILEGNTGDLGLIWTRSGIDNKIDFNFMGNRNPIQVSGNYIDGEMVVLGGGPDETSGQNEVSRTLVASNYFCRANREDEIISSKTSENYFYRNVFDSSSGYLSLRYGDNAIVNSNYFLGRKDNNTQNNHPNHGPGGVLVMGEGHKIYNNYFKDLDVAFDIYAGSNYMGDPDTPPIGGVVLQYQPVPTVKDVHIVHNTIIDTVTSFKLGRDGTSQLGGEYDQPAENLKFINNLSHSTGAPSAIFDVVDVPIATEFYNDIYWADEVGYKRSSNETQTDWRFVNVDLEQSNLTNLWSIADNSAAENTGYYDLVDFDTTDPDSPYKKDINGNNRGSYPDIGAAEFTLGEYDMLDIDLTGPQSYSTQDSKKSACD